MAMATMVAIVALGRLMGIREVPVLYVLVVIYSQMLYPWWVHHMNISHIWR